MGTEPHVSHSSIYLDTTNQCVWQDGQSIALTPKAFLVLRYLAERPGQLITKEELLDAAWPGIYVSDAALKVCIRRLRQALGDLSHPPHYIETVHWRGYRLLVPISTLTATEQSLAFKVHNEKEPRNGHTETHSIPPLSLLTIPLDSV